MKESRSWEIRCRAKRRIVTLSPADSSRKSTLRGILGRLRRRGSSVRTGSRDLIRNVRFIRSLICEIRYRSTAPQDHIFYRQNLRFLLGANVGMEWPAFCSLNRHRLQRGDPRQVSVLRKAGAASAAPTIPAPAPPPASRCPGGKTRSGSAPHPPPHKRGPAPW